jgi:hypothetical protein
MLRTLQIATQSEMISDKWTHDSKLLSFFVSGAEIDAGISGNTGLRELHPVSFPVVDWVRSCASADEHRLELERLRQRLDLSKYSQELLDHAQSHKVDLGNCELASRGPLQSVLCEIAYAGSTADRTLLADCADRWSKQVFASSDEPAIAVVFGVLRAERDSTRGSLKEGESIQVVIRANSTKIPVDTIAKLLSPLGGGRPMAGVAPLRVPLSLQGTISPRSFLAEAAKMVRQRLRDVGEQWATPFVFR